MIPLSFITILFSFQFYGTKQEYRKLLLEKQEEESVETLNMTKQSAKQINPFKVLIDHDTDVRATNFHGTSKNGRS